jgi:hypothetical protein
MGASAKFKLGPKDVPGDGNIAVSVGMCEVFTL